MKQRFSWFCVFLSLVLLFPLFSISVNGLTVDDNTVTLAWWYDDPRDYLNFDTQIVSSVAFEYIVVQVDVVLSSPIARKTIFDFDLELDTSNYGDITVLKCQPLNSSNVALDNLDATIVNNKISLTDLQYKDDVSSFRFQFKIYNPTWTLESDEGSITIDDIVFKYQKSTTWTEWCNSDYNTIGLYIDNGKLYVDDTILEYNGNSVNATDYILNGASYTLEPLGSVSTTSIFYIYICSGTDIGTTKKYQADTGMTWAQWCASSYNVDGFSTYSVSNSIKDSSGRFIYSQKISGLDIADPGSLVLTTDVINHEHVYYAQGSSSTYGLVKHIFDFSVISAEVIEKDEKGLLASLVQGIKELPDKILLKIQSLFVPDAEDILEIKEKFESMLSDRFGLAYDAVEIVDNYASAFVYTESKSSISVPSVTVDLAGVPYTVGGWEVKLIPDGFESVVEVLKLIINVVCTGLFVNAVRKRFAEVIGDAR